MKRLRRFLELLVSKNKRKIRAINYYNSEATPDDYINKKKLHYNFTSEASVLIDSAKWSDRVNEISKLIPGNNIVELGSAEGLLATKLSTLKSSVKAIEISKSRYNQAILLQSQLIEKGMIRGNLSFSNLDLREGNNGDFWNAADTFITCRVIYHFRSTHELYNIFDTASKHCQNIFVLGDQKKACMYYQFGPNEINPVPFFYYASIDGMHSLLTFFGYTVETGFTSFGDPYVIGKK